MRIKWSEKAKRLATEYKIIDLVRKMLEKQDEWICSDSDVPFGHRIRFYRDEDGIIDAEVKLR